jgi:hypothetical protein
VAYVICLENIRNTLCKEQPLVGKAEGLPESCRNNNIKAVKALSFWNQLSLSLLIISNNFYVNVTS